MQTADMVERERQDSKHLIARIRVSIFPILCLLLNMVLGWHWVVFPNSSGLTYSNRNDNGKASVNAPVIKCIMITSA